MANDSQPPRSSRRVWLARGIAIVADIVLIACFPVTSEGVISPLADGIDLAVAVILTLLLGWNIAFLPSFLIKMLPVADLAPTWTLAVLFATRSGKSERNAKLLESGNAGGSKQS
jgi:hypothetical protein